jgi:STAS-like domain of unknown function (DUF4325)
MRIQLFDIIGDFGEDKDVAADLRESQVRHAVQNGDTVVLDFTNVSLVTQSFVHAMISDILRVNGEDVLDRIEFKGCSDGVRGIIETVVQYSLESMEDD